MVEDPDHFKKVVEELARLGETEQLVRLLDTHFSDCHVPSESLEGIKELIPDGEQLVGPQSPYDLLRLAAFSLVEWRPGEGSGGAPKGWLLPLRTQRLAAFAQQEASNAVDRVRNRLHPIIGVHDMA